MVRDDAEACLQAYRFAELALGGFRLKSEREKRYSLATAKQLRDEVAARYASLVSGASGAPPAQIEAVKRAKTELDVHIADAEHQTPVE